MRRVVSLLMAVFVLIVSSGGWRRKPLGRRAGGQEARPGEHPGALPAQRRRLPTTPATGGSRRGARLLVATGVFALTRPGGALRSSPCLPPHSSAAAPSRPRFA